MRGVPNNFATGSPVSLAGTPIIRIQNLNDDKKPFNYWAGSERGRVRVSRGDLLFAWSGTPGTSFGAHIWQRGDAVLNQHIFRVDEDPTLVDREWLAEALNHALGEIIGKAHGGVGLRHITKRELERVRLLVPALSELGHLVDLRRAPPLEMRRRDAICAGIDLDPVPARPRRPRAGEPGRKPKRVGAAFTPSLQARWRDWAAPNGAKRKALEAGKLGDFFGFVNGDLIPHLKSLVQKPNATARQKIIGEALSGVEKTRVDTEKNLLDVLDRVDALNLHAADGTHMFPLSQVYEGLLLKMGDKGNDGGQFFTPREVIRVIVRAIDPKPGETIYDPGCGTGGFLAEAFEHVRSHFKYDATVEEVEALGTKTLFGREKEDLVYPLAS